MNGSRDGFSTANMAAAQMRDIDAHPVDRHVGLHIRIRRKSVGMSQERLAEALSITFQQIQKYERGANRVSASKLWEIAHALRTNVAYFYEGLEPEEQTADDELGELREFLLSHDGAELARCFTRVRNSDLRRKIVDLVKVVADLRGEASVAIERGTVNPQKSICDAPGSDRF